MFLKEYLLGVASLIVLGEACVVTLLYVQSYALAFVIMLWVLNIF